MELRYTVPGTPLSKGRPRFAAGGRAFTDPKTRLGEARIRAIAAAALPDGWPLSERYGVEIHAVYGDARRRDLDNAVKAVLDACNGAVWDDDSMVDTIHIYRHIDRERQRTEVRIWTIGRV